MADITKCTAKNCKIKETCYRFTAYDDSLQSYANLNNDKEVKDKKDCPDYWERSRKEGEGKNDRKIKE